MQQTIKSIRNNPALSNLVDEWDKRQRSVLDAALRLQAIPAPTFEEAERATAVTEWFHQIGLADVRQDTLNNVYGRTPGVASDGPALLISAHLDTVFPAETDLSVTHNEQHGRIRGPGIGDNCIGLAALLMWAQTIQEQNYVPPVDILWAATVGEEGLGDLRGIRQTVEELGDRIGVAIILEGIGLGRVYHAGLGVRRLRIHVEGPGGHSWLHANRPSAIHHLMRMGADLANRIRPSAAPRSSFNIGLIDGGTSINTRAARASMAIDMRSVDADTLSTLEADVRAIINRYQNGKLSVTTEVVGDRPSAALAVDHPLVVAASEVLISLGYPAPEPEIGSTDANIPLAEGIPAICIGITTGGNAHTMKEFIETKPVSKGMTQLALLSLLVVRHINAWSRWQDSDVLPDQ